MSEHKSNGQQQQPVPLRLVLTYDPATYMVTIGGDPLPIALAQAMLHEAQEQLSIQRRTAAAMETRQRLAEQIEGERLRAELSKGGLA
jgi:hypothetical protein